MTYRSTTSDQTASLRIWSITQDFERPDDFVVDHAFLIFKEEGLSNLKAIFLAGEDEVKPVVRWRSRISRILLTIQKFSSATTFSWALDIVARSAARSGMTVIRNKHGKFVVNLHLVAVFGGIGIWEMLSCFVLREKPKQNMPEFATILKGASGANT